MSKILQTVVRKVALRFGEAVACDFIHNGPRVNRAGGYVANGSVAPKLAAHVGQNLALMLLAAVNNGFFGCFSSATCR